MRLRFAWSGICPAELSQAAVGTGLGQAQRIDRLEVTWPVTNRTDVFESLPLDRIVRIRESDPEPVVVELPVIEFGGES